MMIEMARVKAKGQITIPIGIRKLLGVSEGGKVVFREVDGKIHIENAEKMLMKDTQETSSEKEKRTE